MGEYASSREDPGDENVNPHSVQAVTEDR
jgi:hypothetical protein